VWDGEELLVFGGGKGVGSAHDCAAYDPAAHRWRRLADAPLAAWWQPMAVWTGREAILWGGQENETVGLAYDPAADRWRKLPPVALDHREDNTLVWTGEEAIVWGGFSLDHRTLLADGAAYNPETNTWRILPPSPLAPRMAHTAVWTGREMIVWGGAPNSEDGSPVPTPQGAAYNPITDSWRVLPDSPLPMRGWHSAVWTGHQMIVTGGSAGVRTTWLGDTAAYDPMANHWEQLPSTGIHHEDAGQVVWTGSQMIIFNWTYGYRYDPASRRWTDIHGTMLLAGRWGYRVVWTGTDVLLWGGMGDATTFYHDGAIYHPAP
jgi:hypothetical protein